MKEPDGEIPRELRAGEDGHGRREHAAAPGLPPRQWRRSRAQWLGLAAALLVAGCFLFPPATHFQSVLRPAPTAAGGEGAAAFSVQEDGTVSCDLAGLRVDVKPLTDRELNELFPEESQRGRYSTNPYTYGNWVDPRLGYTPNRFTVFEVSIFNRTEPKVMLNPLAATLETDRGERLRAYGISSASAPDNFENYYRSRRGLSGNEFYRFELRMGIVRSHNYEHEQPIFKGENYGGFLVFDPVHPETRQAVLTLNGFVLRFGAFDKPVETRDLRFAFDHRVERERIRQELAASGGEGEGLLVSEDGPSRLVGNLPGDRTRNASAIQAVVRQRLPAINRCFAAEFDKGEAQEGQVVVGFTVEVGGAVSRAAIVASAVASRAVDKCLEQEVARWTFRPAEPSAPPEGSRAAEPGLPAQTAGRATPAAPAATPLPVDVTYPFTFSVGLP